jgi:hypothetical protein
MDAFCKRQGLQPGSVRFTFDGNRINENSTAGEVKNLKKTKNIFSWEWMTRM